MLPISRRLVPLAALVSSIVLSGCAKLQPIPLQPLAATAPGDPVRIYWLHAYQVGSGIRVVGTIRPRNGVYRSNRGHIDVTAVFADQREARTVATRPGPLSRRGRGSRSFSVVLSGTAYENIEPISARYHHGWPHMPSETFS
ncbi:hypothetical protein [Sphingomonas sp.]|uniref:hypothetical protein n=1 Tax=Sphingomonas sp. TaxID=28214 RepID=UPI00185D0000|nr:hypothetical protein [Sphingomonas sp.]MBA4763012.1 hypothetical protein [Sphingomonas sp.]